jgi:hypothetical protein
MRKFIIIIITLFSFQASGAHTFPIGTVIRDAEIEAILLEYLRPIAKTAGLTTAELKVYVIVDPLPTIPTTSSLLLLPHPHLNFFHRSEARRLL